MTRKGRNKMMTNGAGVRYRNRDWTELKGVVAVLCLAAGLVFVAVHFLVPRDHDIVLTTKVSPVLP
jgi:hypothetical protein